MAKYPVTYYRLREEIINVITHFLGLQLSIGGLVLLIVYASFNGTVWHIVSFSIFGASMVTLYLASTLYHYTKGRSLRKKLNVFDHSAIYILIAGTYTPYCLVPLNGVFGWILFGTTWGLAIIGIILKTFYMEKYSKLSTIGYVLMGWVGFVLVKPLIDSLSTEALIYLLLGGISYTVGAVFYAIRKIPYNHAIFHVWVLIGSVFHFISIFFYLW